MGDILPKQPLGHRTHRFLAFWLFVVFILVSGYFVLTAWWNHEQVKQNELTLKDWEKCTPQGIISPIECLSYLHENGLKDTETAGDFFGF